MQQQRHHARLGLLTVLFILLLSACSSEQDNSTTTNQSKSTAPETTIQTDFELSEPGILRILAMAHPEGQDSLPRSGESALNELQLAQRFAEQYQLPFEIITVARRADLIPFLLDGKGDLIADNLTVTDERKEQVLFTQPLFYIKEQIVSRKDDLINSKQELKGRRIAVHASSSHYQSLQKLQKRIDLEIEPVAEAIHSASIIAAVGDGQYDLALADSHMINSTLSYEDNIRVAMDLGPIRSIAWATHTDAPKLHKALNEFISRQQLLGEQQNFTDDLDAIKKRGVLRIISRNNAATYYLWQGELLGFEYELLKHFAEQNKLRVEMVIPPDREQLFDWLREGHGDVIAASLTKTAARNKEPGIQFSRYYNKVSEVLVGRDDETAITDVSQLAGRTVVARKSSSYWQTLLELNKKLPNFKLQEAPEDMETEEIIARVAEGEYDLTVADEHLLSIELTWRDDVQALYTLSEPVEQGWMVRKSNPKLLKALNRYLNKEYRGLHFNVTYNKYFKNNKRIRKHAEQRSDKDTDGGLSPYDDLVQTYAGEYGFDWQLITSQMYQESRFNPDAKSWVGAQGLMQVMPRTGKELGFNNLKKPENGIQAGIKYLSWLMQRFEPDLDVAERTWFALASYNAGVGHVRDARTLAKRLGLNPDVWFDNVEKAMLLLSKKKYYRKARHGYVRGKEPVEYVRKIRERFMAYRDITA